MPARNDPCPCGSGKKYKHCHLAADDAARQSPHGLRVGRGAGGAAGSHRGLPPSAEIPDDWEIALVPLPITLGDTPHARPVAIVVAAGPFALHVELESTLGADASSLASATLRAYAGACDAAGKTPRRVSVRDEAVASVVRPTLAPFGVTVRVSHSLPDAEQAAQSLAGFLAPGSNPDLPPLSRPETWAGWGLDRAIVGRLHVAAAAYYRAAPWKVLADDEPIFTGPSDSPNWTAVVMGNAGMVFGLALYQELADLATLFNDAAIGPGMPRPQGAVLSLTFDPAEVLPPRMKREVLAARWEVAGPRAWPVLIVMGTPGGGVTAAQVEELIARLDSVPRFVRAHRAELAGDEYADLPICWNDPANGLHLELHGTMAPIDNGELEPCVFVPPEVLAPSGPEGPGARPGATLHGETDLRRQGRSRRVLVAYSKHLSAAGGTSTTMLRRMRMAREFLAYLIEFRQVPLEALSEFDLRQFLYSVCASQGAADAPPTASVLASLRHVLAFVRKSFGLRFPWAAAILADRDTLEARFDTAPDPLDGAEAFEEWRSELFDDMKDRALLLPRGAEVGVEWAPSDADDTSGVSRLAHGQWLVWRDEAIRAGTTDGDGVYEALVPRLRAWLEAPNAAFGGKAPRSALGRRRAKRRQ